MRPAEVSPDEIAEAGRRLIASGKKVNGWSLRAALGNKGKPERLMEVWQRTEGGPKHGAPTQEEPKVLPPGVAEMADEARVALVAYFDGIVLKVAVQVETELKSRYKADFDRLIAARADMSEQLATASTSVSETEQVLAEVENEAETLRARLAESEKQIAVAADRLRALEVMGQANAAEAKTQIVVMNEQIQQFCAAAQEAGKKAAGAEATAVAVEREARRLRDQAQVLTRSLEVCRSEFAEQTVTLAVQRDRADRSEADLARVRQERDAASVALETANRRFLDSEDRYRSAEARATAAEQALILAKSRAEPEVLEVTTSNLEQARRPRRVRQAGQAEAGSGSRAT